MIKNAGIQYSNIKLMINIKALNIDKYMMFVMYNLIALMQY